LPQSISIYGMFSRFAILAKLGTRCRNNDAPHRFLQPLITIQSLVHALTTVGCHLLKLLSMSPNCHKGNKTTLCNRYMICHEMCFLSCHRPLREGIAFHKKPCLSFCAKDKFCCLVCKNVKIMLSLRFSSTLSSLGDGRVSGPPPRSAGQRARRPTSWRRARPS
jgi:hypothetical protein